VREREREEEEKENKEKSFSACFRVILFLFAESQYCYFKHDTKTQLSVFQLDKGPFKYSNNG